jgi:hypothetical protein
MGRTSLFKDVDSMIYFIDQRLLTQLQSETLFAQSISPPQVYLHSATISSL